MVKVRCMCKLCNQSWMRAGAGAGHGRGSAADTVMKEKSSPTIITGGKWGECFPGPGKSHGQRNRMGYSLWGCKELDWATNTHTQHQFSFSDMSNSLRPRELEHTRPPCPSPTPGVHPNPRQSNLWCHPTISSSVIPFSSCPQSFPASGCFPMSQLDEVAKVLEFQPQHHSFQWTPRIDLL